MLDVKLLICQRTNPLYVKYRDRHYISNNGCHGQQLHYLVTINGTLHGVISGASAVFGVKSRDDFFCLGRNYDEYRQAVAASKSGDEFSPSKPCATLKKVQLNSIINNVVYRIEGAPHGAASQILSAWRRRISSDWEELYGVKVAGFETFVVEGNLNDREEKCTDRNRTGALYLADNWEMVGITAGNTKTHSKKAGNGGLGVSHKRKEVSQKLVFVKRSTFGKKNRPVPLCTEYKATWQDKEAQKEIQRRRKELMSRDEGSVAALTGEGQLSLI